jgi:DUF4097 and DUF4098 domain-containing protein YvlB
MKIYNLLLIALFTVAVTGANLFSQTIQEKGGKFYTELKQEFQVQENGTLTIQDVQGNVEIQSWASLQVRVEEAIEMDVFTREEAEKILEHSQSGYSQQGNEIIIRGSSGKSWIKRNFKIKIPEKFNVTVSANSGNLNVARLQGAVKLATSGGNIQIQQVTGEVSVRTSGGNLTLSAITGALNAATSGGNIVLEKLDGPADVKTSGGNIDLRGAKKEVVLKTSGGNLTLAQVDGNVQAATSGGSIDVTDCSGSLLVKTSGGNIHLRNLSGSVTAKTSGGDIEGENLKNSVEVKTSGGDIELLNVQSSVTAATSAGNIEVELKPVEFSRALQIDLRTSAGDIKLSLPEKMPATIHAEIALGRSPRFERYDIYSDFPLSKNKAEKDGETSLISQGEINGGGTPINLRTSAGNIRIGKNK